MRLVNGILIGLVLATSQMAFALEKFSVNDQVQVNWNDGTVSHGAIRDFYRDGTASISFENRENAVVSLSALNKPVAEMDGFRINDEVYVNWKDKTPSYGKILEFYRNKTALVYFETRDNTVVSLDSLSFPITEMAGFQVGDLVHVNWANKTVTLGQIRTIYRDGSAYIEFDERDNAVVPLSVLNKPITSVEYPK